MLPALLALALGCSSESPEPAAAEPPPPPPPSHDILLVVIDTQRADRLGVYGYDKPTSPELDDFAEQALVFDRAYAQSSWTLASMASLLAGVPPRVHKAVRDSDDLERFGVLPDAAVTLPEVLSARGYKTAAWTNNIYLHPRFGMNQGFDLYDARDAWPRDHRTAQETVDDALMWLRAQSGPVFAMVHLMEPHLDYGYPASEWTRAFTPEGEPPVTVPFGQDTDWIPWATGEALPEEDVQAWVSGLYDADVRAADAAFGALIAGLEEQGRLDRTLIVVTSDHGEELFDHGRFEHGHTLRSVVTRVPLLVRGPGVEAGRTAQLAQHIDVYRTLIEGVGLTLPDAIGGMNLLELAAREEIVDRALVQENCLFRPNCLSLVTPTRRLELVGEPMQGAVYALGEDGQDLDSLSDEAKAAEGPVLQARLAELRGGLTQPGPDTTAAVGEGNTLEQLQSLGYLDR